MRLLEQQYATPAPRADGLPTPPAYPFADGLLHDPAGFWTAGSGAVSHPDEYHDLRRSIEEVSFWCQHRNKAVCALVGSFPPAEGWVADIGGGNGDLAWSLQQAGVPTVVVEPQLSGVLNARRRGLEHVVHATAEGAGLRDDALGGIGLFDVIEHLADDIGLLTSLSRKLAPAGRVYITVPAYNLLWSPKDERVGHFRRYTTQTLARAVRAAGLVVEYSTYFFWLLPLPQLALRGFSAALGRRPFSGSTYRREHVPAGGWLGTAVGRLLAPELRVIARRQRIPFGGSCMVVARRPE